MEGIKTVVVFCNWKRIYRIDNIIYDLNNQKNKIFDIVIWNNQIDDSEILESKKKNTDLNITIINSPKNIGGIGRFVALKNKTENYDTFIFFDDDQELPPDFIDKMLSFYEPKTIKSRYGWKLNSNHYFDRNRITNNTTADYCGTGGMVGDINIFNHPEVFEIPKGYEFIEDLWLSYVSNKIGFKNYGIPETLIQHVDGNDQFSKLKQQKVNFLRLLVSNYKWKY